MTTVYRDELTAMRMVAGNEKKYSIVVDGGVVKEWVGFGWIEIGRASDTDRAVFPVVVDRPPKLGVKH